MAPAVERRERSHRSDSPARDHHSPRRRNSERHPARSRSPQSTISSHRATRSPARERPQARASPSTSTGLADHRSSRTGASHNRARSPGRSRSPKPARRGSPARTSRSRSPVPHAKRSRHTHSDQEADRLADKEHGRNASREDGDKGRHRERGERDRNDDGFSRPSRRERSVSPAESGRLSTARKPRADAEDMNGDHDAVARMKDAEEALEAKEKQKPSFELSGKLAEETNRFRGITLLFSEPPDARKADTRWRLYVFKAGEVLNEPLYVHRQSCYLFGRERRVADIPTDHPSCSKQHAVLQYRLVEKEQLDGLLSKQVRPYLMDLGSTNGTFINDNRIEPQRYYELFEKDTIKFGNSSREYVLLHENSAS